MKDWGKIGESDQNGVMMWAIKGETSANGGTVPRLIQLKSFREQFPRARMQRLSHEKLCFEEFTLDLRRGCLLHFQQEIKLRPKSFEVLKYLVENSERLISKDELITAVWVDTAVTDSSLVQCLKDIRHALHDESQQIIKTVHGRGHIFDREVRDDVSTARVTTYSEETTGVQVIIEEEESNGHRSLETAHLRASQAAGFIEGYRATRMERLTTALKQHRWGAGLGFFTLAVVAAAIFYFTTPGEAIDSIAVMPFVNVSGDPNTEYLSDGVTESLINSLSQLPNLKVMSRNSVFNYKGRETNPVAVGRELGVKAALTGRIIQRGDNLSISVELVDARDNSHLWGDQYDRKLSDVLSVQREITREITEKLRLRLTGEEQNRVNKRYTENTEAYQLYLKGRYHWNKRDAAGLKKSIEYYQKAIEKDPAFALAYAGIADSYIVTVSDLPPGEKYPKAKAAAVRALEIDSMLAEPHAALARITFEYDWNLAGAENEYLRAIKMNPNYATAHQFYASFLTALGRFNEGIAEAKQAQALDPVSLSINTTLGNVQLWAGQYDQAIEQFKRVVEMDQNYPNVRDRLANAYAQQGMNNEAVAEYLNSLTLVGESAESVAGLREAYATGGIKGFWRRRLRLALENEKETYVSPVMIASIYARLDEKDKAFERLEKAYQEHSSRLVYLKVSAEFDSLHSDPRFTDLLHRLKLAT